MIRQLAYAVKYLLGQDVAGRHFIVLPDDRFIVSYPRSGNTWARFLIANLTVRSEPVDFTNIEQLIPDIGVVSKKFLRKLPRPRLIKSHEYFDARYKKVIYIVRDPRDVALSYYRFHIKFRRIDESHPIDDYMACFVAGELDEYGSWGQNVGSWLAARHNTPDFLLLRYEDMSQNTESTLAKIAEFLHVQASPEQLRQVIELSSPECMRKLEKKQSDDWVVTKGRRKDIPFIGNGRAGGWRSALSENSIALIEQAWGPLMSGLGYEVTHNAKSIMDSKLVESILE